jgi:hypothetical protein
MSVRPAPAPAGDPLQERDGTVLKGQTTAENSPRPGSIAPSPEAALLRYALAYINWQAANLATHERALASLAVGQARLAAQQTAAAQSTSAVLARDNVRNEGVVVAIALGKGPARTQWVVVTQERTTGTGPYAGLPSLAHVTLARVSFQTGGWAVSEWSPSS